MWFFPLWVLMRWEGSQAFSGIPIAQHLHKLGSSGETLRSRSHFSRLNCSHPPNLFGNAHANAPVPVYIDFFRPSSNDHPIDILFCFFFASTVWHSFDTKTTTWNTNQNKRNRVILVHDLQFFSVTNQDISPTFFFIFTHVDVVFRSHTNTVHLFFFLLFRASFSFVVWDSVREWHRECGKFWMCVCAWVRASSDWTEK